MVTIKFKTDNAAFGDGNKAWESARILHAIADKIDRGETEGNVRDINGNTIGTFKVTNR